jgi:hypothetical protein
MAAAWQLRRGAITWTEIKIFRQSETTTSTTKKVIMKMKMHIAVAVALLATSLTGAAQLSGNITISGTVANSTSITVASQAGYNTLNIAGGATAQLVAIATEKSNDKLGYTVTLNTANAPTGTAAFLKGPTGNADQVPYTMTYNGVAVTLVAGSAVVTSANARTPSAGVTKNLNVTIPAVWVNADTYSDTITLTIAAL